MSGLTLDKIRKLQQLRDRLIGMLRGVKQGVLQGELLPILQADRQMSRLFGPSSLKEALWQVLNLYDTDFYKDPASKRWSLSRRREIYDAAALAAKDLSSRRTGTTHAARVHEHMNAAEA